MDQPTPAGNTLMPALHPVVSVAPLVLPAPGRGVDLQLRVSAPVRGDRLPVVVFSHGFASSCDAYAPLAQYWAARGLVVIQPTFLDSRTVALAEHDPRAPEVWRIRVEDVKRTLDGLETLEQAVPGLAGRIDRGRIAAAGHSFGAHTTSLLLGARMIGPDGRPGEDLSDPRICAGVLLCAAGRGGADLSAFAREHTPYLDQSYAEMTTRALVVAGDADRSPLTVRGPDWFADPFILSPGADWLLTVFAGEHMLGGISGDRVTETTDESPERVEAVQRLTYAYLRSALQPDDPAWDEARRQLAADPGPPARLDGKA